MLHPENRLTLIDAMRPPAGFRFESAMAVTFTLDLTALLSAPAALTLTGYATGGSDEPGDDRLEPVEFVHALRSHADRLTVFSQAGEIALPPSRQAFAFLERAILPVSAPSGGVVHPKVWVIRYETAEDPARRQAIEPRLRVLVSSRNLTFDASWDTMVRLDEASAAAGASLQTLGELFTGLLNHCSGDVPQDHRTRVHSLAAALQDTLFALPAGVDDLKVHVLGLEPKRSPLPSRAERSLIISPFVSDDFFAGVHAAKVDELVSRSESLDCLAEGSLSKMDKIYTFDDGGLLDRGEEATSPSGSGRPLAGLHAKVFAFENGRQANLFLGSANATGAAFRRNVEILVELAGHTAVLGIDRLCGADDDQSLRNLFHDYRVPSPPPEPNGEPDSLLDRARRTIAELDFKGEVEPSGADWAVTYRTTEPVRAPEGVTICCWPVTSTGHRHEVAAGKPLQECFETSLENLSGFLAFELAAEDGTLCSFVVPTPLKGLPEERDRLLLRSLIGNAERFFRYLMAMLDEDSGEPGLLEVIERISDDNPVDSDTAHGMSLPVLEKLLRTLRHDPDKLAGLHPLVSDLADDGVLPARFEELWTMIHDVTAEGAVQR